MVALNASVSKIYRDRLVDRAVADEAIALLKDVGYNGSALSSFHCYGHQSQESVVVEFMGRADVAQAARDRWDIVIFKNPTSSILSAQSLAKVVQGKPK